MLMNGGLRTELATRKPSPEGYLVLVSNVCMFLKIQITVCCGLLYMQEGDQVNTHVTAPGAILALSLMFLKTNDRWAVVM